MKRTARTLALMLAVLMLLAAFPMPSFAAAKVKTLQKNHWYNLWTEKSRTVYYKLVLSSDSVVTVHWKNNWEWAGINFSTKADSGSFFCSASLHDRRGSDSVALAKGTYYVTMDYEGLKGSAAPMAKVTVAKPVNKANFSKSKAITLKANSTVKIAQTANNSYDRWYKIRLTRQKTVTIRAANGYSGSILLYDSEMNKVGVNREDALVKSKKSLRPGTYYIRVRTPNEFEETGPFYLGWQIPKLGFYISIKWS